MSNYTPSGNPTSQTRGIASVVRNEFVLIQTAINSKADPTTANTFTAANIFNALNTFNAGITVTGAANFTGATLTATTQAQGDNSTKVATTEFVATQVFAAVLPAQSGNSGKYISTNGTSALWTDTMTNFIISGYRESTVTANSTTAYTFSIDAATLFFITLTGNVTYTFPTPAAGKTFILFQKQDGTGSRTVTWPGTVKWSGGTAPTITATAAKMDAIAFTSDGTNWYGRLFGVNY